MYVSFPLMLLLFFQIEPDPLCRDTRRAWFIALVLLLVLACCASASMVVHVREDYMNAKQNATLLGLVLDSSIIHMYEFSYKLAWTILVFCTVITLSTSALWLISESLIWPREREFKRQIHDWAMLNYTRSVGEARLPVLVRTGGHAQPETAYAPESVIWRESSV